MGEDELREEADIQGIDHEGGNGKATEAENNERKKFGSGLTEGEIHANGMRLKQEESNAEMMPEGHRP